MNDILWSMFGIEVEAFNQWHFPISTINSGPSLQGQFVRYTCISKPGRAAAAQKNVEVMAPDLTKLFGFRTDGYASNGVERDSDYEIPDIILGAPTVRKIKILSVGAGVSGIMNAYLIEKELENVEHVIYEKNPDIGGTWLENRYPGMDSFLIFLSPSTFYLYISLLNNLSRLWLRYPQPRVYFSICVECEWEFLAASLLFVHHAYQMRSSRIGRDSSPTRPISGHTLTRCAKFST